MEKKGLLMTACAVGVVFGLVLGSVTTASAQNGLCLQDGPCGTPCPNGSSDCAVGEICITNTCCGFANCLADTESACGVGPCDADTCGTFTPCGEGGSCFCFEVLGGPTQTPTETPTVTPTATPTATPTNTPKLPDGAVCTDESDCASGFSVSGVCCDTACDQPGEMCNLQGQVGTCTVPIAVAPVASRTGLLIILGLLVAVGGFALIRRRELKHYLR